MKVLEEDEKEKKKGESLTEEGDVKGPKREFAPSRLSSITQRKLTMEVRMRNG